MVDPAIFQDLQARVDADTVVRDVSPRWNPSDAVIDVLEGAA
jgi:hypothetical protein